MSAWQGSSADATRVSSVIFVHGLGANPDTTWTATLPNNEPGSKAERANESRRICWVRDLWVNDIPAEVRRKTRVFFYNHDSGWQRDGVQGRLSTLASRLLHELRGMTQIRHGSARGGQVVRILTHCDRIGFESGSGIRDTQLWWSSGQAGRFRHGRRASLLLRVSRAPPRATILEHIMVSGTRG